MKSIDEMRELLSREIGEAEPYFKGVAICDEIEAEVERDYMRLPVDADGVPIHVGDTVAEKPFHPEEGEKPAEVVCMLLNSDEWSIGDCDPRGHWFHPATLEHVKPRTLDAGVDDALAILDEIRYEDQISYDDYSRLFDAIAAIAGRR